MSDQEREAKINRIRSRSVEIAQMFAATPRAAELLATEIIAFVYDERVEAIRYFGEAAIKRIESRPLANKAVSA